MTDIGDNAFHSCIRLSDVTLPKSIRAVGKDAFSRCLSLNAIHYGGSAEEWSNIKQSIGDDEETTVNCVHTANAILHFPSDNT